MKRHEILILLFALFSSAEAKLVVTSIMCNFQKGMAVVDSTMQLGWQLTGDDNGERQKAYQLIIEDKGNGDIVYDSHRTESDKSQQISVPVSLERDKGYLLSVRVWNQKDEMSKWSRPECVYVAPRSIEAVWIGAITKEKARIPEGRYPNTDFGKPEFIAKWSQVDSLSSRSIILRKTFISKKRKIVDAIVYVCGLGHYELTINGDKVGDSEFAPLWTDYDKTVYYNVYDVKSYIRRGGNSINVLLGNGFYNIQRQGRYSKLQESFGAPKLLLRMKITYEDGSCDMVCSGEDWKYTFSPITYNCIYGGESYDARLEIKGLGQYDYDDSRWHEVVRVEKPQGQLVAQVATPVKIMEHYGVKSYTKIPYDSLPAASKSTKRSVDSSAFVLDMGQNLAGYPLLTVSGKRGMKITMFVAEKLKPQGVCDQSQTGCPYYYEYILKGEGAEIWHPRFSYYGFRYIQVEGAVMAGMPNPDNLPVIRKMESCFIYNSAPEVSAFECSNPLFTRTHRLIERAERSNMQSVMTDCPHREKLGWLEEDHLCGPSLLYNYDLTTFVPKILHDISDAQRVDGMVPTIAPRYVSFGNVFDDSPEWGSTAVILPFMYYDQYGDSSLVKACYPMMCRYIDYLSSKTKNHILDIGLGDWFDYGPWVAGYSRNTFIAMVATSHYLYDLQLIRQAAMMIGDKASMTRYSALLDSVTVSFNNRFYHPDSGSYDTGSQTANSLPLFLNLTGLGRDRVLASLIRDIHAHGNRLTTGDVGNRYLFQALARNGQNELLYKMLNHYEAPGYGFQLQFDATTLTEQWDPRKGSSWNHFMMGQIDEWLFCTLGGIQNYPGTHGLRHLLIKPILVGDLTWVKASTQSVYGNISVSLTKSTLTVEIPVGSDATIVLPDGTMKEVNSGKYTYNF